MTRKSKDKEKESSNIKNYFGVDSANMSVADIVEQFEDSKMMMSKNWL